MDRLKKRWWILLFVIPLVFWMGQGIYKSHLINSESLLTVGIIRSANNNTVTFDFVYDGFIYEGFYAFSPGKHHPRKIGDKIYVRFSPKNPGGAFYAPLKDKEQNVQLDRGQVLDSLNHDQLKWWWLSISFWTPTGAEVISVPKESKENKELNE